MGQQHVPSMECESQLGLDSLGSGHRWNLGCHWRGDGGSRLFAPALYIHAIHALLRAIWVDLVCRRPVRAGADAFAQLGPAREILLREHYDLPVLGPALCNSAIA